ncbi:MAG TPA: Omp28-related outer membrane protein [Flavobacterium sp.]|nr:Omp28-related outer membrane protein [Flavobacterium sp.]
MKKITILIALVFFSFHANAQVLLSENFDTALDWTVAHTAGPSTLPGWTRVTAGTDPACAPFSGAGMAEFNSYDVEEGNTYTLTSPAITFAGNFYKVSFNLFRDGGLASSADRVRVFYSTTGNVTGSTLLTTVNRATSLDPVVEADGWYAYDAYLPNGATGNGYIIIAGVSGYGNNMYLDNIVVQQINTTNDAQLTAVNLNTVLSLGTYPISGTFRNLGANAITSIDLNWQAIGGPIHTQSLTGLNIAPAQSYNFTHAEQWVPVTGAYDLLVWVSNTNGGDSNEDNDLITKSGYVVNEIFPKTVVYEEATGTWCGWCVRGHIGLKDMDHYHPDGSWIGIAVHNADPMVLAAYDGAMASYISGYPSGAINRNPSEVDPGLTSIEAAYQTELAKTPLAKVDVINQTWNPTTRVVTFDAQSIFALDMNNANYNLSAVIVENGVTGTTANWRQHNYYTGNTITDWTGFNWGTYPAYIPAATMVYNHVGRALLGGFTGVSGSIPASVVYNTPYTHTFSYTVPAAQNAENIEIVVMLLDNVTGKVANAKEVELNTVLGTTAFNTKNHGVYPNPTTGVFNINTDNPVSVTVADFLGKVVYRAANVGRETAIDLSGLQRGIYFAQISGDNTSSTEKIILK